MTENQAFEMLLPMYVIGQLDGDDLAFVEGQLAQSETCRAMLIEEQQLRGEIATLPVNIPEFSMAPLDRPAPSSILRRAWEILQDTLSNLAATPVRTATFAGLQAALIAVVFVFAQSLTPPKEAFKTLSSGEASQQANAIIMFKPDTREQEFRSILTTSQAVIVGGPTEASAYLVRIPAQNRADMIAYLSRQPQVTLAQALGNE